MSVEECEAYLKSGKNKDKKCTNKAKFRLNDQIFCGRHCGKKETDRRPLEELVVKSTGESDNHIQNLSVGDLKTTINQILPTMIGYDGHKIPSNYRKLDLEKMLEGLNYMIKSDIPLTYYTTETDREIKPVYVDEQIDTFDHLKIHGWTVIDVPEIDPIQIRDRFFDYLESISLDFDRNNGDTWLAKNTPYRAHGIFKQYFGHHEWQWMTREATANIFAQIYGVDQSELLVAFDGACFLPTTNREQSIWYHADLSRPYVDERDNRQNLEEPICVQGFYNINDSGPDDGGLTLIKDSLEVFDEYSRTHPIDGLNGWLKVDIEDRLLYDKELIKICAPAGSIILWDSRMFHCNRAPTNGIKEMDRVRMGLYISMQPRYRATDKELKKRIEWYLEGRQTDHWCYGPSLKATARHSRYPNMIRVEQPETDQRDQISDLRRSLIGY